MPFAMTHLLIAHDMAKNLSIAATDLPMFYLGNLAPDAVHYRPNYDSDMKKASHLCVGDEKWGMLVRNDEWAENAISFLKPKNSAFALGYCVHILSDIYNNIAVWTPYRIRHAEELKKGYGNSYHKECGMVDFELAQTHQRIPEIMRHLRRAVGTDLGGFIFADEIEAQRQNILGRQYENADFEDTSNNQIITYESTMTFISEAVEFAHIKMREI